MCDVHWVVEVKSVMYGTAGEWCVDMGCNVLVLGK